MINFKQFIEAKLNLGIGNELQNEYMFYEHFHSILNNTNLNNIELIKFAVYIIEIAMPNNNDLTRTRARSCMNILSNWLNNPEGTTRDAIGRNAERAMELAESTDETVIEDLLASDSLMAAAYACYSAYDIIGNLRENGIAFLCSAAEFAILSYPQTERREVFSLIESFLIGLIRRNRNIKQFNLDYLNKKQKSTLLEIISNLKEPNLPSSDKITTIHILIDFINDYMDIDDFSPRFSLDLHDQNSIYNNNSKLQSLLNIILSEFS